MFCCDYDYDYEHEHEHDHEADKTFEKHSRAMQEDPSTYPFWTEEIEGGLVRLGLCESFLENLDDDPIAVELASPGARIRSGETLGFIYTPEQPYELRAPRALEIVAINEAAETDARIVKAAPYGRGWLMEIKW